MDIILNRWYKQSQEAIRYDISSPHLVLGALNCLAKARLNLENSVIPDGDPEQPCYFTGGFVNHVRPILIISWNSVAEFFCNVANGHAYKKKKILYPVVCPSHVYKIASCSL